MNGWDLIGEVEGAAEDLGIRIETLAEEDAHALVVRVEQRLGQTGTIGRVWERLKTTEALRSPDGWRSLARLPFMPVVLWLDPSDALAAWRFKSGEDIVRVLEQTHGFEFYVTDEDGSFLACFNHHDVLIGAGTGLDWVRKLRTLE